MNLFHNHPFAVSAFFEYSLVLTYAFPAAQLEGLVPAPLLPDLFEDKWAFVAVAMVQTKSLKPSFMPSFAASSFMLTGYRIFVKYTNNAGKRRRGLYILRSETDSRRMQLLGNIFTSYNYVRVDMEMSRDRDSVIVKTAAGLHVAAAVGNIDTPLPAGSPFNSWKEARRFAGPMPFTFSVVEDRKVLIVEGRRDNWTPAPADVNEATVPFLHTPAFHGGILSSAFIVEKVPYHWKRGRLEKY